MKFYKRVFLTLLSVLLLVLSFPHADLGWIVWIALVPVLIAVHGASKREYLSLGGIFGFFFTFFHVDWFGIFGWEPRFAGSLYFGLFLFAVFALWGWFQRKFPDAPEWQRLLLFPLLWTAFEWLKQQGVMAFTCGFLGYTQYKFIPLLQIVSVTGIFGISFFIAFFNNLVSECILEVRRTGMKSFTEKLSRPGDLRTGLISFISAMIIIIAAGLIIIPGGNSGKTPGSGWNVGVTQPNFPQNIKWMPEYLQPTMDVLLPPRPVPS